MADKSGLMNYFLKPLYVSMKQTFKSLLKPETILIPFESAEERAALREGFRGQHSIDWGRCIGCGLCSRVCPNECITMEKIEVESTKSLRSTQDEKKGVISRPAVDIGLCLYCGFCAEYCPTDAWEYTTIVELAELKREGLVLSAEALRKDTEGEKVPVANKIEENPQLDAETCIGCKRCERNCPTRCIEMVPGPKMRKDKPIPNPKFDYSVCVGCKTCVDICPSDSLRMEVR
ncbi:MAG: 4Fe-4S binding protein [Thermoplasmata archaeon]|nr:4Fe-4S binding protein [Thermoplasmata archaeon]